MTSGRHVGDSWSSVSVLRVRSPDDARMPAVRSTDLRPAPRRHPSGALSLMLRRPNAASSGSLSRGLTRSQDALRVVLLDGQRPERIREGLPPNHVPRLVIEELLHDERRLPRIPDREFGPVVRRVVLVLLGGAIVVLLGLVEPSEVHAEGRDRVQVLRVFLVELESLLVEGEDLVRLDLWHPECGLRFAKVREGVSGVLLECLVEVLVRGLVVESAAGLVVLRDLLVRGGHGSPRELQGSHKDCLAIFRPASETPFPRNAELGGCPGERRRRRRTHARRES